MQPGPSILRCVGWTAIGIAAVTLFRNPGQAGAASRGQAATIERLKQENASLKSEVEGWTRVVNEKQSAARQAVSLIDRAQLSFVDGNYSSAIRDARASIDLNGESHKAWRVIGTSSCLLKDAAGAKEARKHVQGNELKMMDVVCKKSGVAL